MWSGDPPGRRLRSCGIVLCIVVEQSNFVDRLTQDGCILLTRFLPELSSDEAFARLGMLDRIEGLNAVQTLKPSHKDQTTPNTYSGNFGNLCFPLHTDLAHWAVPPRYVALRCILGACGVTTRLLDGRLLIETIGIDALRRALVQPRRPLRNRRQLLCLLERCKSGTDHILRWDTLFLTPASPFGERISSIVLEYLSHAPTIDVYLEQPGDTLIIDNWRILHGRSSIPENASRRHIDRAYLAEVL
ncbi:MAG: hypothetical protein E6J74_40535 [Deltaproteobacteria bacterium]|nr:MAG: hypothetical protein E6J74_40535 [Deltaproteobacteria bacterium]